jgi:hypothetical protein
VIALDPQSGGLLVGIITETDLLQYLIELLEKNLELVARLEEG